MTGPWCWTNRVGWSLLQRGRNDIICCSHPGKTLGGSFTTPQRVLSVRSKVRQPLQPLWWGFSRNHTVQISVCCKVNRFQRQSYHTPWRHAGLNAQHTTRHRCQHCPRSHDASHYLPLGNSGCDRTPGRGAPRCGSLCGWRPRAE